MHILLPPSEGKAAPAQGPTFDLERLSFPELSQARATVLSALLEVSRRDDAARILKVGVKGAREVRAQRGLPHACCVPARELYTGVLYEAARLHEGDGVLIFSGLFGVTTGEDLLPAYRLSMGVSLPGVGPLKTFWRKQLQAWRPGWARPSSAPSATTQAAADQDDATVDLRSEAYRVTKSAAADGRGQWWNVRIANAEGRSVSHMAKHYRGLLARTLLDAPDEPVDVTACSLGAVSVERRGAAYDLTLVPYGLGPDSSVEV